MREPMPPPIPDADPQTVYDLLIVGGGVNGRGVGKSGFVSIRRVSCVILCSRIATSLVCRKPHE